MEECRCATCEEVYGKDEDFKDYEGSPICNECLIDCLKLKIEELEFDLENK
jgi:hypothetical protein